jgi:hypothetical protein
MKTIFTLLLSSLFSLSSMAYNGTRLTVTSVSNSNKMFVEVDGRRYSLDAHTVTLTNIRPGVHTVRVLREVKRKKGWNIDIWSKKEDVIYSIKATLKNGYDFDIVVNRFGKVMIDERMIDDYDDWYNDDDDYYDNNDRGWDNSPANRDNDRDLENNRNDRNNHDYDNDRTDRNERDSRNDRDNDYDDNHSRAMSNSDFIMAKENLRKEWFENNRVTTAKQVIDKDYFTSQQVKELVSLFTFENNKLEIAKYAYSRTVDKENYDIVNDAFSFNNSKEALDKYIRELK